MTPDGLSQDAQEQLADNALAQNPRDIAALVKKADCLMRRSEDRSANVYYSTALRTAGDSRQLWMQFAAELQHAREALQQLQAKFEEHVERRLAAAGYPRGARHPRFQEALDIAMGRREAIIESSATYVQEPTSFFYPKLPQRQFYERAEFAWVAEFEAAAPIVRTELDALLREDGVFRPYMEQDPQGPVNYHSLIDDPSWSAFYLSRNGSFVEENVARCPQTAALVQRAPIPRIKGGAPNILFSLLRPNTHIPPHTGIVNTSLICHLPVITPPGCQLRVGTETRTWEQGKMLIFDDSIEHEAWNRGSELRVVLLFDIWRPELTDAERAPITTLFEAVEEYRA